MSTEISDYRRQEESITLAPVDQQVAELGELDSELLTINMGPHHPATHGVLRLLVTLEGEVVRDLKPIIESSLMLAFLSSPIIWSPDMINHGAAVLRLNPLTHLFAIWREPLATGHVPMTSVVFVLACLAFLAVASIATLARLRKAAFWI